jgi:hypothetical protein
MPTYSNAYEILKKVRYGLSEYSDPIQTGMQGATTHPNELLMDEINSAQLYLYSLALNRSPGYFIGKAEIVGVDSEYALPNDYGGLIVFLDDRLRKVERVRQDNLTRSTSGGGSKRLYYHKGSNLVLDKSGVTDTYTLWYRKKPRNIHAGRNSTAGTAEITLDERFAARIDDYYNGMIIENVNENIFDQISDYVGTTRVATITNNSSKADFYGLVSDLPEVFHHLIAKKALLNIRTTSALVKSRATKADMDLFNDELVTTFQAWSDGQEDVDIETVFSDFAPAARSWGIVAE